jgi:DNA helicase-2/ATP-dependent DNA helicase PcrA
VENEFPSWFSVQDGDIEEEKRLFYVAMTRAKQRLFISSYQKNEKRYKSAESRFIHSIPPALFRRQ